MYTYYTPFSSLQGTSLSSGMVVPTLPVIGAVPFIGLFQTLEWLALLLMLAQQWCPQSSVLRGYRRTSILLFRMKGNICSSKNSEQANSCHTYVCKGCIPVCRKAAVCTGNILSSVQDAQNLECKWQSNEEFHGFLDRKVENNLILFTS